MTTSAVPVDEFIPCHIAQLTDAQLLKASKLAQELNPARWPNAKLTVGFLAVDMKRWWNDDGQQFTVAFMDNPSVGTRARILDHANEWNKYANVSFVETGSNDAMIRITRDNSGYWSYLGTDILGIPRNQPTMNLQGFTEQTSDGEYRRVVRHEFGHTLGFPHEHMRKQLVDLLDVQATIKYFRRTQGWTKNEVMQQVLTPLNEKSIRGTPNADDLSIMCYQLPAEITRNGQPIRGGDDINPTDAKFIGTIYPKPTGPVIPPVGDGGVMPDQFTFEMNIGGVVYTNTAVKKTA